MILDPQLLAKIFECDIVESLSIVRNEDPKDFEATNDASPDEATDILFCDSDQWFDLDPFGKVVDPYDEELKLSYSDREGTQLYPIPIGRKAGGVHRCKFLGRSSYDVAEALALVTHLYVGLGILL